MDRRRDDPRSLHWKRVRHGLDELDGLDEQENRSADRHREPPNSSRSNGPSVWSVQFVQSVPILVHTPRDVGFSSEQITLLERHKMPVSTTSSRLIYDSLKAVGVRLMSALPETWLVHLIRMAEEDPEVQLVRLAK